MIFARKAIFIWAILLIVGLAITPVVYGNMLQNASFETLGPIGSPTSFSGFLFGGYSAAQDWLVWNNTPGTTVTELLPSTLPGGGTNMLHVITDPPLSAGSANGVFQTFLPINTGPTKVFESAWIYVVSGQVGIGTGNDGNTQWDTLTSTTGKWEFLHAFNGISPANEFIIYSYSSQAEFYVDNACVTPVPEPSTMLLLGSGLIGLWGLRRKFMK